MYFRVEWDEVKAVGNFAKHRVSFQFAARVFADPLLITVQDRIEGGERRWQSIGMVDHHLVLLVAHTVAADDDGTEVFRIVSARKADPKERKRYEQNR